MKKLTKATIAAAAGVALLLGTGGTLAYWNDSADLAGTSITAGNLKLAANGDPVWQLQHTTGAPVTLSPDDLSTLKIVPGDKLIYTGNYTVAAQGRDLVFSAGITGGSIAPAVAGDPEDIALAAQLVNTATYSIGGVAGATSTIKHRNNGNTNYPVSISVTLDWPFGTAGTGNTARLGSVNLDKFTVAVTQLDGTTTP